MKSTKPAKTTSQKKEKASEENKILISTFDPSDPLKCISGILEKKARNLEKRKTKGEQLKLMIDQGKELNEDQKTTAAKINEIASNLELLKDISGQVAVIYQEYLRTKQASSTQLSESAIRSQSIDKVIELQINLKKVVELEQQLKDMNLADDGLSHSDVDSLVTLCKSLERDSYVREPSKNKAILKTYQSLLNSDSRVSAGTSSSGVSQALLIQKMPDVLRRIETSNAAPGSKQPSRDQKKRKAKVDHTPKKTVVVSEVGVEKPIGVVPEIVVLDNFGNEGSEEWQDRARVNPPKKREIVVGDKQRKPRTFDNGKPRPSQNPDSYRPEVRSPHNGSGKPVIVVRDVIRKPQNGVANDERTRQQRPYNGSRRPGGSTPRQPRISKDQVIESAA